jgi:hypothetical protein
VLASKGRYWKSWPYQVLRTKYRINHLKTAILAPRLEGDLQTAEAERLMVSGFQLLATLAAVQLPEP